MITKDICELFNIEEDFEVLIDDCVKVHREAKIPINQPRRMTAKALKDAMQQSTKAFDDL